VLFAAGLLILLDQSADLIAILLSRKADMAAPNWRFGLFGLVINRTSALLVGDVMLLASATALGWRNMLKVLGSLHLVLAACALTGLALFGLDAVQVRGAVPAHSMGTFTTAALRTGVVALAGAFTLAWAGVAAWRTAGIRPRSERQASPPLVVTDLNQGPRG
jgi:hypothetical protein